MAPTVVALFRSPTYSPAQHAGNDTAILDATLEHFAAAGWRVARGGEDLVIGGGCPAGDLYLNMCQGVRGSEALVALERGGAVIFNRPSSVLGCHRHRLVDTLDQHGVRSPATVLMSTDQVAARSILDRVERLPGKRLWVKRGDVHAERADDVISCGRRELSSVVREFARRGIATVAVQEHIAGPIIKFYGVAGGDFFKAYDADTKLPLRRDQVNLAHLRELAFAAAACVGLDIFGGDVALAAPDDPVLIDLNDWPSFAPVRAEAALAIAAHVSAQLEQGLAA